jgi:tRNA(fMet)-specific endonuclease VapC
MIILETDHLSMLEVPENPAARRLSTRRAATPEQDFVTSVVSFEEQARGWLAEIRRQLDVHKQVTPYVGLLGLLDFLKNWRVIRFDLAAANEFKRLRKQKTRIGTMDQKIAAIALVNNALLLAANLRDFRQVPGLRVESWIDS